MQGGIDRILLPVKPRRENRAQARRNGNCTDTALLTKRAVSVQELLAVVRPGNRSHWWGGPAKTLGRKTPGRLTP
jgi:hypothetical protein